MQHAALDYYLRFPTSPHSHFGQYCFYRSPATSTAPLWWNRGRKGRHGRAIDKIASISLRMFRRLLEICMHKDFNSKTLSCSLTSDFLAFPCFADSGYPTSLSGLGPRSCPLIIYYRHPTNGCTVGVNLLYRLAVVYLFGCPFTRSLEIRYPRC